MSAFLCSANHLSLIANASCALAADATEKDRAFAVLLAENVRSLNACYPGDDDDTSDMKRREATATEIVTESLARRPVHSTWGFKGEVTARVLATQIVKACDCYDYQACETRDYESSEAAALVARVREAAIKIGGQCSGSQLWDQLMWGIY
jgi:hypothetical protein